MAAATKASSNMLMALIMVAGLLQSASAVTHTLTWTFGANGTEYDEWASRQTFAVGDEIAFVYESSAHNVYEVTRADLDSCNLDSPIKTYLESNAVVPLDRSGYFGFICGVAGHCSSGNMLMNVEVAAAPASVPSTTPTTSPPSTPRPMLSPPSAPTPAPPPSSDASSLQTRSALVVGVLVAACAAVFF